ncbi:unnamed protein product [Albugo candida]|uniref:Uncharacterized protein n=1 Tax=Albugo candida TaxID=65357 RepID=A0A024GI74_9STRA|nr:unnamed protein product [Albugo candida]|eukprot:CCI46232.1 unnamed protein product [Albugo candida]
MRYCRTYELSNYLGETQNLAQLKLYWRLLEVLVIILGPITPHNGKMFRCPYPALFALSFAVEM